MKKRIISLTVLALGTLTGLAETYYIAPTGNDRGAGSESSPFATLAPIQGKLRGGDTVYFRGGTYRVTLDQSMGVTRNLYQCAFILDRSGQEGAPITYSAYPGERPVFDMSGFRPDGKRVSVFFVTGSWLHLRGLEVIGTQVTVNDGSNTQSECFTNYGGSHNVYEQLSMHDGMAIGWYLTKGSDNLVLNCDAYNNYDDLNKGGNVDGFGCHPGQGDTGNVLRGCRAWWNSDDGFDLIHSGEAVSIEDCWAFYNGFRPNSFKSAADGNGFKAGGYGMSEDSKIAAVIPMHKVTNCLAVYNRAGGFYSNHHLGGVAFINNTAVENRINFNMVNRKSADEPVDVAGYGHVLAYNVSYDAREADLRNFDATLSKGVFNSFLGYNLTLSNADFVSVDRDLLVAPRNEDGSLPDNGLFVPTPESPLTQYKLGWTFPAPSITEITNPGDDGTSSLSSWLMVPTIVVEGTEARLSGPLGTEQATTFYVNGVKVKLSKGVANLAEYIGQTVTLKAYDSTTGLVATMKTTVKDK